MLAIMAVAVFFATFIGLTLIWFAMCEELNWKRIREYLGHMRRPKLLYRKYKW